MEHCQEGGEEHGLRPALRLQRGQVPAQEQGAVHGDQEETETQPGSEQRPPTPWRHDLSSPRATPGDDEHFASIPNDGATTTDAVHDGSPAPDDGSSSAHDRSPAPWSAASSTSS